jgi:hypothetical protein
MAGKTHSRYLSAEQAEVARQQIEQGHKLREQVEQYREACEQWADAQLERSQAASTGAAEKGGLQTDLQNEIVREIADLDFEVVEMAARCQVLRLAARLLEQRLNTDTSDHVGPQRPCPCGGSAQYHGRHGKPSKASWGLCTYSALTITVSNARADPVRGTGLWGWKSFSLAPGVLRMTASAAALLSFEESSGLLHELAGVEVRAKQVEGQDLDYGRTSRKCNHGHVNEIFFELREGNGPPPRNLAVRPVRKADGRVQQLL